LHMESVHSFETSVKYFSDIVISLKTWAFENPPCEPEISHKRGFF